MESNDETLAPLRELKAACEPTSNKHQLATVLIIACIDTGWTTRGQIVQALTALDLDRRHINIILNAETGNVPERHRWRLDADGRYRLLEGELTRR
jgi:hypothetical protein